ncbi:HAD-IIIA family hydrolase [archaeon]|jgi:histidinol-phosphate phosphatase family protein|nr:HAD-IIIA family hydrolase [archaeon]MBT3451369.1 HAD-IIIA family hydrolase [archaeon]MBT6869315.1 HAD-IIIA family hydrolase [archaeon]MBT7192478.1 HAD-IIIA family hydrolase [archaeon]MBT7380554.1 HAD-IIIA family hydrolase [archaeon]
MLIKQAVILCGGLGTRLKPITDHVPKPMAEVNGKPFLEYLILQLKDNGIKEILLLTGYKKENIEEYFKDGARWEVNISYSRGDTEWDTGKRIYQARNLIDTHFLLLYSDNFVQFNLNKLIEFHNSHEGLISLTLFQKKEGNNIIISEGNKVLLYDKKRQSPGLKYVELGYMIVDKKSFQYFDESNFSFSNTIKNLVDHRQAFGLITKHQYYSISDPDRLKLMGAYLSKKKIILLDRDGIINAKAPKGEYITSPEKFTVIPSILKPLNELSKEGYSFIVISNQAGIARGKMSLEDLNKIDLKMKEIFRENGINILKSYYCPHHWEEGCYCRKPNPGMLINAANEFKFRLDQTFFIGDDERDVFAAYNAECKSILVGDHYNKKYLDSYPCEPDYFAFDLEHAKSYILNNNNNTNN